MEKKSAHPDRRVIEQEALGWLIRLDGDEPLDKQELDDLRKWLGQSPAHRAELNSLNNFWSNNILTELVVPLEKHKPQTNLLKLLHGRSWSLVGAASTVVVCVLAFAINMWLSDDPVKDTNGIYLTAVGQQKSITLADGSMVQLNTDSRIAVTYSDLYRNIKLLQGEAHFVVAGNSGHPFRVYAGVGLVEAVGTAFTVFMKENSVNVLVTEGQVELSALDIARSEAFPPVTPKAEIHVDFAPHSNGQPRNLGILKAGESFTLDMEDGAESGMEKLRDAREVISDDELYRRQSWRDGLLVFSGEPLEQVIREISRYTTISIEIADPDLRQIQIGGRFRVGDIDNMFSALETNFGLRVEQFDHDRVQLKAAE